MHFTNIEGEKHKKNGCFEEKMLHRKTAFIGRQPLLEDNFCGRQLPVDGNLNP